MDGLDAPFEALRGNAPDLIELIVEDEAFLPPNEALINHPDVDPVIARILRPVMEDPAPYLMRRQAPYEEVPAKWTEYSGLDYEGMDLHLREEWEAYMGDEEPSLDRGKLPSADADAMSSDSPKVEKRGDSINDNCRLMEAIGSSHLAVASIGLPESAMPSDAPASFVPVLDPHQ